MVQKEGFLIKIAIVSMFISTGKAPSLITGAVTFSPGAAEPRAIIYFATERRAFDGRLNYDGGGYDQVAAVIPSVIFRSILDPFKVVFYLNAAADI
jgi:hypothetical protein